MKKKIIILVVILLIVPAAIYSIITNTNSELHKSPAYTINHIVWFTQLRISDSLTNSIEKKQFDFDTISPFLTLYGVESQDMSIMLGDKKLPPFSNGYNTNDYFVENQWNSENFIPNEQQLDLLVSLRDDYKQLSLLQSQLVNDKGELDSSILSKIMDLDQKIIQLVK